MYKTNERSLWKWPYTTAMATLRFLDIYLLNSAQHIGFLLASQGWWHFQWRPYSWCRGDGSGQDQTSPWGFNLHMSLGASFFLTWCSQFFKTKPPKPKAKQTKELAPTRIFKPVLQRQGSVTKNCSKAAGSIAFNSPLSPLMERTSPLYHLSE